ncbi:hypothetical protein EDI_014800 [Entamoeba dispar SAW760]|uniref:Transmembrane protein n=1 Tax=Entamoeba dispar (strain ATCC PRA-260 / SAW760) TaxID=370354 RepID=B0EBL1_ENTDS|nr:uncharacterized protein EDI_014800 [Entamoeba dispar SAW760]EDR28085.1 hypothetical protein EDI_014800 [Entamoeba dispar SAW760]|eukprot:EDR28085.1 hypothetical protein EDI_014800 [Entamoeba dispar SAW760]
MATETQYTPLASAIVVDPQYNQQYTQPPVYTQPASYQEGFVQQQTYSSQENSEQTSMLLFILGFFTCLTWVINIFMFRDSTNDNTKKWVKLSKILLILYTILIVGSIALTIIISIISVIVAVAAVSADGVIY